jgi:hypothetical protein
VAQLVWLKLKLEAPGRVGNDPFNRRCAAIEKHGNARKGLMICAKHDPYSVARQPPDDEAAGG